MAQAPGGGVSGPPCEVWPFGRLAKRRPPTLLAGPPLKLLTRELLGRKGACKRPRSPHFRGATSFLLPTAAFAARNRLNVGICLTVQPFAEAERPSEYQHLSSSSTMVYFGCGPFWFPRAHSEQLLPIIVSKFRYFCYLTALARTAYIEVLIRISPVGIFGNV